LALVWALAVSCREPALAIGTGAASVEPNLDLGWLSVGSLAGAVVALMFVLSAVAFWGRTLSRKLRGQTAALESLAEAEASKERHNSQLDQQRSQILEDINSSRPLAELIEGITQFVSFSLNDAPCWCETVDGTHLGKIAPQSDSVATIRREIPARSGGSLGTLFAAVESSGNTAEEQTAALETGERLAALAIETRKLYKDLVYRSEFDLLTDVYNRTSLERYLEEQIQRACEQNSIFGLIYIDLDDFKHVNDTYGHRIGDLYLQEVSLRMKRQLRSGDMLARLGGDEFAALVPVIRNRDAVEEIAQRLERCFDAPFAVEGYVLRGAASVGLAIYPEDGTSVDHLLGAADGAVYVSKHTKRNRAEKAGRLQKTIFRPLD
jgi:diguanylate cyclase (GGDEF)-like protein